MDNGVVAGSGKAVARVIAILKELGPRLGFFLNDSNCKTLSSPLKAGQHQSRFPLFETGKGI